LRHTHAFVTFGGSSGIESVARWLENEGAYSDVELLRDLMQREQFQSNLDSELRVWLIDQKPKNLSEAARLADQYVAVRKADRPVYKGQESSSKGHVTKPKSFGESERSNTSAGFQKTTSFGHNAKPYGEQKSSSTSSTCSAKFDRFAEEKALGLCFRCRKPGHRMSNCLKRRARQELEDVPVQLVSTAPSPVTEGRVDSTAVQKPQEMDPRFGHCSLVTLLRPDNSRHIVRALRDTGALQSLVSQQSVTDCDYESTEKSRLICSVLGETVSVPLVRVSLQNSLCSGSFLCGLATSLPAGIDILLGNDLRPSLPAVDVAVATRFQSAAVHREAEMQTPLERCSYFCTAHVSFVGHARACSPKNCTFVKGDLDPHVINGSLGSSESVQPFLHSPQQNVALSYNGPPIFSLKMVPSPLGDLNHRVIHGSLRSPEPSTETASPSVQPFLHSSPQSYPILYNGPSPSKLPLPMGNLNPM